MQHPPLSEPVPELRTYTAKFGAAVTNYFVANPEAFELH